MDPAPVRDLAKPVAKPVAAKLATIAKLAMPAQGRFRRSGSFWVSCPLHQKAYPSSWVGVQVWVQVWVRVWVRVLARAEPVVVLAKPAAEPVVVLAKPAAEPGVLAKPVA